MGSGQSTSASSASNKSNEELDAAGTDGFSALSGAPSSLAPPATAASISAPSSSAASSSSSASISAPSSSASASSAASLSAASSRTLPGAPGGVAKSNSGGGGVAAGERWWLISTLTSSERVNPLSEVQVLDSHLDIVRQLVLLDGTRMASGSDDGTVIVWQCVYGQLLHRFEGHTHGITVLLLLSDGETLASGSADRTVRLWNVTTYQHMRTLTAHESSVTCLERLDAGRFCSGGNDQMLRVWSNDGTPLGAIERQEVENLHCLLYVGNDHLITGSNSSMLLVYQTSLLQFHKVLASTFHRESVRCLLKLSKDKFASASLDGTILLWHATSLTPLRRLHYPERYVDAQKTFICDVKHLLSVDDGHFLAAAIGHGYVVYDVLSGDCTLSCPDAHNAQVTHLASLYGGARLLSCSVDGTVKLWAPPTVLSSTSTARSTFFRFTSRLTSGGSAAANAARKPLAGIARPRFVEPPLRGHTSSVWLALPLSANSVATCSSDGIVLLWRDAGAESARRNVSSSEALVEKVSDDLAGDGGAGAGGDDDDDDVEVVWASPYKGRK
jgi:WD40 repeat protein